MKKKDWFRLKKYPHIDRRILPKERQMWIEKYVSNPDKVAKHAFLPFIHKVKKVRKFRKTYDEKTGHSIKTNDKVLRKSDSKTRDLYYAGHLDSLVYSYYAEKLNKEYEKKLKIENLGDVVLAYRAIPINPNIPNGQNKCNIDFANEVFEYIRNYPKEHFLVITFDIKSFFDELDHNKLLASWSQLVDSEDRLPKDHFNVYKSLSRFSYIDLIDIFKLFQNQLIVQQRDSIGKLKDPRKKRVSKIKYLKKEEVVAFCTKEEFLRNKNKLVKHAKYARNEKSEILLDKDGNKKIRNYGIPQGTPISAVLANAYLLDFDKSINNALNDVGGIYRRYSDDMIVICPFQEKDRIIELFHDEIDKVNLRIQKSKTQIFHFKKQAELLSCEQEFESGFINSNKKLVYLGFEFDGVISRLKPGSLSSYYRKMKKTVARSKRYAAMSGPNHGELFKRRILNKYSYKGANRKRIWIHDKSKNGFVKTDRYDWGNFLAYTTKAAGTMRKNRINSQTKQHWKKLNGLLKS